MSGRESIVLLTLMSFSCDRASILRTSHKGVKMHTAGWPQQEACDASSHRQYAVGPLAGSRKGRQSRNKTNRNSTCTEQKSRSLHCKTALRMNRFSGNCRHLCRFSCRLEAARSSTSTLMPSSPLKQVTRSRCQRVRYFQRA